MMFQAESYRCSQCGSQLEDGITCRERFENCLALEYAHPQAFGAAHFLLVGCYMLQHNEYSREVWREMRQLIRRYLNGETSTEQILRQNKTRLDSGKREFHITRGEKLREFSEISWSGTIQDVRLDTPDRYVADVIRWAGRVMADTAFLFQRKNDHDH